MGRPRRGKRHASPAAPERDKRNDTGPRISRGGGLYLCQHADVRVRDEAAIGRRARREYIHHRLLRAGRISAAEYEAGELWARDHAVMAGARGAGAAMVYVDSDAGRGPTERAIVAASRVRRQMERLGPGQARVLALACCEGVSTTALALRLFGAAHGRARVQADDAVIAALGELAGTRCLPRRRDSIEIIDNEAKESL